MMRKLFVQYSRVLTLTLIVLAAIGYYLATSIQMKLSLTDLLPENHPAVVKFNQLTEVVGGVGYFAAILETDDGKSHLEIAPKLVAELEKNPLVRSAFFRREQRFFVDHLLYFLTPEKLEALEKGIVREIQRPVMNMIDLGLDDEKKPETATAEKPAFDDDLKKMAKKSAKITPELISGDRRYLLLMIKPTFDSLDLKKTEELVDFTAKVLKENLPSNVKYHFAERYYTKLMETKMITSDIFILGSLSIICIALIILLYLRSWRATLTIFIPVFIGMGITTGLLRLCVGHINIVTGFLMGIVSGLGVDYGIHLVLRLRLERKEASSSDPDPIWRTLASSGHSVFVGAAAASFSFYLLCFSSFRAFSEFGFVCGTGIACVLIALLVSFSSVAKFLGTDREKLPAVNPSPRWKFPVLPIPRGLVAGVVGTLVLIVLAKNVGFEYDFGAMMRHSKEQERLNGLVDEIYDRSTSPSVFAAATKEEAAAVEKVLKDKYMPKIVAEIVSGATIVPEGQEAKQAIIQRIQERLKPIKDRWIEKGLGAPASSVRTWVESTPFKFDDIPVHLQDLLRGKAQAGYLIYFYPEIRLNNAQNVRLFANMIRDIEKSFPKLLTGSDAVVFADILDLIERDGSIILFVIFIAIGLFIFVNTRSLNDTLWNYIPLLVSLPVGMGLMYVFGKEFNIFNIAIIPTFVAMGIDVPIHIVHRAKEVKSGFRAARDLAASINLALATAGIGFGVLIFARAGVLRSLGWIALIGTVAIWWVGIVLLPAFLELLYTRKAARPAFIPKEEATNQG